MHCNSQFAVLRSLIVLMLVVAALVALAPSCIAADQDSTMEVICPEDPDEESTSSDYCDCVIKKVGLSRILQVKCDFKNEKDALLTSRIHKIRSTGFSSAYVRISNAKSVQVNESFMREWQEALSSALDIWHSGSVELVSSPPIEKRQGFKTFVGIGIIDCQLSGLPAMLIRDHHRGALRIKDSTVGVIQPGFIHNIDELRYLVFEDSKVSSFAGPVTTEQSLTLSHRELHSWNGLLLHNVTVQTIAPHAFNLTHLSDLEEVVVRDSTVGEVGSAGLTVSGDIKVNITGNTFANLQQNAFQVGEVQELVFTENTLLSWVEGALASLRCPAKVSLVDNCVATSPDDTVVPTIQFHPTCGNPQMRTVTVKRAAQLSSGDGDASSSRTATALVLVFLAAVTGGLVAVGWWWRGRKVWRGDRRDTPLCEDQDQPDTTSHSIAVCHTNKPDSIVDIRQ